VTLDDHLVEIVALLRGHGAGKRRRMGRCWRSMTPSPNSTPQRPLHMGGAAQVQTSDAERQARASVLARAPLSVAILMAGRGV